MSDDSTNSHAFQVQRIQESTPIAEAQQIALFQWHPEFMRDDDRPRRDSPILVRVVAAILFLIFLGIVVAGMLSSSPFSR